MGKPSEKRARLLRDVVRHAERMIQAGLSRTTRTCSTPSCGCHADRRRRHGPHTYLTFRAGTGKSTSVYVKPEHVAEALEAKAAWDRFWDVAVAVAALNRKALRQRWQGRRRARATR